MIGNSEINSLRKVLYDYAFYLRINASALSSVGLYEGKAGIALALFEVADLLQNADLENYAVRLLEECLVTSVNDLSFQNGWAGILYVVQYLTQRNLLSFEIDDLLYQKEEEIYNHIKGLPTSNVHSVFEIATYSPLFADRIEHKCYNLIQESITILLDQYANFWNKVILDKELPTEFHLQSWAMILRQAKLFHYQADEVFFENYKRCVREELIKEDVFLRQDIMAICPSEYGKEDNLTLFVVDKEPALAQLDYLVSTYLSTPSMRVHLDKLWDSFLSENREERQAMLVRYIRSRNRYSFSTGVSRLVLFLCWKYTQVAEARNLISNLLK